jgi:hypothetical protein
MNLDFPAFISPNQGHMDLGGASPARQRPGAPLAPTPQKPDEITCRGIRDSLDGFKAFRLQGVDENDQSMINARIGAC